jgi:hypothetical protein
LGLLCAFLGIAWPRDAEAFCRTGTCPLPEGFLPTPTACVPSGFTSCVVDALTVKNVPVWWKNACVGYDLQKDASMRVSFADATQAMADAFAAWTTASCPGTPSIAVRDLGPVACTEASFTLDGTNQNVVVFHDDVWPHSRGNGPSPTIALTTVSFNRDTGEILDADIEINTADHIIEVTTTLSPGVYDLESVLTHEAGHFLGLAHSPSRQSVMYYEDEGGSARHRTITDDDLAGICAIYPPGGIRSVDVSVSQSSAMQAGPCDPTPRNGLSSACSSPAPRQGGGGCSATPTKSGTGGAFALGSLSLSLFIAGRAIRRRRMGRLIAKR